MKGRLPAVLREKAIQMHRNQGFGTFQGLTQGFRANKSVQETGSS